MFDYYCPKCLEREFLGAECACGLLWKKERRSHGHYAVLLDPEQIEKRRHAMCRRQSYEKSVSQGEA